MKRPLLAFLLLLAATRAPAEPRALDGTRWKMRYRAAKTFLPVYKSDKMAFDAGRFSDTECSSYGFAEAPYEQKRSNGKTLWRATQFNPDGERADWEGEQEGDRMEGTLLWSRPDGRRRLYKFKAKLADAGPPALADD